MTAWLGTRGIDAPTAGRLQGTADLMFIFGVLLAGLLADWKGFNRRLFLGYFSLAVLGYALLGFADRPLVFALALSLISFAFMPLTNLADTHLQPYVSRGLLPYARIRALGSAAFTLILLITALMTEQQLMTGFYPAMVCFLALAGLALMTLPPHPVHMPTSFLTRLGSFARLLRQPRFLLFYLIIALIFGSHGAYYIYAVPIWRGWGFSSEKIYGVIAFGVIAEILFFVFAPRVLTEQRAVPLLLLCTCAAMVRWLTWPFVTGWAGLLMVHSLHVFTFALTHLTSLAFLRRRVPEGELGAAQALLPAISVGVGMASSKFLAAQFIGQGAIAAFFAMAAFAGLALPLLLILHRTLDKPA